MNNEILNDQMKKYITELNLNKINKKRGEADLIVAMKYIWPIFYESNDMILLNKIENIDINYIVKEFGSKSAYEDYMNHIHIVDIHDFTLKQTLVFGLILKDIWKNKLKSDFPGNTFRIALFYDGKDKNNTIIRMYKYRKDEHEIYDMNFLNNSKTLGIIIEEFA